MGRLCLLDIIPLAVFSDTEWQLMNTTSAVAYPWHPLLSQFAGGCLADERKGAEGQREKEKEGEKDTAGGCHTFYRLQGGSP